VSDSSGEKQSSVFGNAPEPSHMVRPTTTAADAGRNLLFGILALQNSFIGRDALLAAFNSWVADKSRSLGEILVEQAALSTTRLSVLEALVQEHLRQHGGDTERSLAAVSSIESVRRDLHAIADPDLQASLPHVAARSTEVDPDKTLSYQPTAPGFSGERFHIIRFHAKGGLGEVHIARDEELHRDVALKRIQDPFVNDQVSRSRFVLEAEVTGGLEHPGIVPVYGLGCDESGRPFYAMRFIKGDSLKDAIAAFHNPDRASDGDSGARSLAVRKLLGRFIDVCNAMAYAHSRGILHRDLKPSNVMLGAYGETLVVDWGLAKVIGRPDEADPGGLAEPTLRPPSSDGFALTQTAIGTPQYMSPEQAAADMDRLGPRSDVYSLGATLYTLLTGQAAIARDELHVMLRQVQKGEFPPPRQLKREVPVALDAICRKAMALEPESRYATARDLADDVEHWLADEPVSALPETVGQRSARWMRRHRTLAQSLGVAALFVIVSSVAALFFVNGARQREHTQRLSAEEERGKAIVAQRAENEQRRLAEDNLYLNNIALANRESASGNYVRVNQLLEQCPQRLRGWEWHYLNKMCNGDLVTLKGHLGPVMAVDFSPDDTRIVSAGDDGTARIWDAATGKEIHVLNEHAGGLLSVKFSPDGRSIASAGRDATVRIWDATTGREARVLKGHTSAVAGVAYSPDGRMIASAGWDKTIKIWEPATGREVGTITDVVGAVVSVAFSLDGERIASASMSHDPSSRLPDQSEIAVHEIATGRRSLTLFKDGPSNFGFVTSASFISGNRILIAGMSRGGVVDAATGSPSNARALPSVRMAFSPNGRYWATATGTLLVPGDSITQMSETPGLVTVSSMTNDEPDVRLLGHNDEITQITFASDNRRVATASLDGTVKIWQISPHRDGRTLLGHPAGLAGVAFSNDGERLATGGGGQIRVWDLPTGRTLLALRSQDDWAFSPLGTRLAVVERDLHLMIRNADDGRVVHTLDEQFKISGLSFSPDGRRLAAIVGNSHDMLDLSETPARIKVWDFDSGRAVQSIPVNLRFFDLLHFSHDSRLLALSVGDSIQTENPGRALIWDVASGRPIFDRNSHPGGIYALAFSPDDKLVVTTGRDGVVTVWDLKTTRELRSLRGHTNYVDKIVFGQDGRTLVTRGGDSTLRVWDVGAGQQILVIRGSAHMNRYGFVSYSPDGRRLITEGFGSLTDPRDKNVVFWDVASGQELLTLRGFSSSTVSAAFTPDGKRLVSAAGDGKVKIWEITPARGQDNAPSGRELADPKSQVTSYGQEPGPPSLTLWGHENAVNGVVFSPLGDRLASASDDETVKIWNAAGKEVRTIKGHRCKVLAVGFNHDGTRIVSAGDDGTVRVWDASADGGDAQLTLRGHNGGVVFAKFDSAGTAIATGGLDGTLRVWEATSGRPVYTLTAHQQRVTGLSFSPDGTKIATAGRDAVVKIWDLTVGSEERVLKEKVFVETSPNDTLPAEPSGVSYSRHGGWVASANGGDAVMIWDSETGRLAKTLTGGRRITDVEFAPRGRLIASAHHDGTVRLWDIESGKEIRALRGHTNKVTSLSFSPDGTRLASSSLDGTIELWAVAPEAMGPPAAARDSRKSAEKSIQDRVRRAMIRSQFGQWADADREVTALIDEGADRESPQLLILRGRARVELGRWSLADDDFVVALDRGADIFFWFAHALLRLQLGDIEGYREACQRMLDRFDKVENPELSTVVADTCALAPEAVADLERPVQLCERLLARDPKNQGYLRTLGQNLYRAGRYEDAIKRLDEAALMGADQRGSIWDWLFRAMAHHKLGHTEDARKWFEQSVQWINQELPANRDLSAGSGLSWNQRLGLQLMRREAEAMIKDRQARYLPKNVFQDPPAAVRTRP
jgi:eukaryotic-like serine/threonine-protein kinase